MTQILIAGYHGFGNCGDEATLLAMKNNIPGIDKGITLTALSFKPDITSEMYGIESVQRFNIKEVYKAITKSDIIVSGGGSLLQDETSTRSLLYYLGIIFLSKSLGKKVMLYSNGIGPVRRKFNRFMIKKIINKVDMITLREESSAKELKRLGVTSPPIHVTADPAFTLAPVPRERVKEIFALEKIPFDKPLIGVSIRDWKNESPDFIQEIALACDNIHDKYGYNILLIPMQHPLDISVSQKVSGAMKFPSFVLNGKYTSDEIIGVIGSLKLMISMRLHALIFAGIERVPMMGIVYDPKVEYYLKVLDMPSCGDVRTEKIEAGKIVSLTKDILENPDIYRQKLDVIVGNLTNMAKLNEDYLKRLM